MARSPLFEIVRRGMRGARGPRGGANALDGRDRRGLGLRELIDETLSRRRWLARTGALAGAMPLLSGLSACGESRRDVAVVGAGLAGLTAARRLAQAGLPVDVYDAGARVGGRTFSLRDHFADGIVAELGGELVDTDHVRLAALAAEVGLELDDLAETDPAIREQFFIGGERLEVEDVITHLAPFAEAVTPLLELLATDSDEAGEAFARFDEMSLAAFLDASEYAVDPTLRSILEVAFIGEFGLEIAEQSSLNLLSLIDPSLDAFRPYGDSDERYHIRGGNDGVAQRVAASLDSISLGHRLELIARSSSGRLRLSFRHDNAVYDREYDQVVLALPFSTLRHVTVRSGLLGADKQRVIAELGYGLNAKLMIETSERVWRTRDGASGSAFCDNGLQTLWETSRAQEGEAGVLTHFVGGDLGVALGEGEPASRLTPILPALDEIFPGTSEAVTGRVARMHWPTNELARGSYACYRPGQWSFLGLEGAPEGDVFFAGEHTSIDYQGFMEGAVESGERVAGEVLARRGLTARAAALVEADLVSSRTPRRARWLAHATRLRARGV